MHASEREARILSLVAERGFVSFRELERQLDGSPATIRRDLERLAGEGKIERLRGGVKTVEANALAPGFQLAGVPFHENIARHRTEKAAIGHAAAALCEPSEGVMIDGGSTTLQMCPHLAGLNLSVLTNSLHIVAALLNQAGTRVLVPGGAVFPDQSIILSVFGEDAMPRFHAPKLFMGAASIGAAGLMQADPVLVAAERRLIDRAERIVVLADASKFAGASGSVVCGLEEISVLVTDARLRADDRKRLEDKGVEVIVA
ncbi:DeoR/GlpR family DNA-binding transcription regulator [Sphingomonas sp. SUN039]|nr:DeoR/GlpR family DNA-binding transcription regulator [Sphingomonas sp. SUN039]